MKLASVSIKNFRSIIEITKLPIDDKLTTLVGANEHGKSNILQALRFLDTSLGFSLENDVRHDTENKDYFPEICFNLILDNEDIASIELKFLSIYDGLSVEERMTTGQPTVSKEITMVRNCDPQNKPVDILGYQDPFKAPFTDYIDSFYRTKVIYFDDFNDRLLSNITETELINTGNEIVNGLLKLSGLDTVRTRLFENNPQIRKLLTTASPKITEAVRKNWNQGDNDDLTIYIDINHASKTLIIDIQDKITYGNFEARSRGFKWFLSFFLKYSAYSVGELKDCIFLLDEPGLFLHPRGQKDLLNYFEEFAKYNQIVYSTHSPFMINRLNHNRVRVVEKFDEKGTLVNVKGHIKNWNPLRSSLGLALSDSFYYADNTLLVEGPEDRIYILSLLKLFAQKGERNINLNILSIIDSGGSGNLPPMAKILKEDDRPLLVLIDSDSKKSKTKLDKFIFGENLKEISQLGENAITIQDLLPVSLFEKAVNNFISILEQEGDIERKSGKPKMFATTSPNKIDADVDAFTKKEFEDEISKVGIANEFEKIILDEKFPFLENDFTKSRLLLNWVITNLNLEIQL